MFERFVAGALRARWIVLVIGTVTVSLVLPSGGSAQGRRRSAHRAAPVEFLDSAVVKVNHGFKLSLEASNGLVDGTRHGGARMVRGPDAVPGVEPAAAKRTTSMNVDLSKVSGKGIGRVSQYASYAFESGITFKGSTNLSSAKLTGTLLDHRGTVNLTFHATEPAKSVPVPKNCTGSAGMSRTGMLEGKLALKADKLGTEKLSSLRATLVRPPKLKNCSGGRQYHSVELFGYEPTSSNRPVYVEAIKTPGHRPLSEFVEEQHNGTGFEFEYQVSVNAPRSDYTYSSDLSTGQVEGYGAIKGSASYAGGPETSGQSDGELSGDLSATSTAIGKIQPFSNGALSSSQTQS